MIWNPTQEQLVCRDLLHAWRPSSAYREGGRWVRVLTCSRCRTGKLQYLDRHGYVIGAEYVYSDGYLRAGGGRLGKSERAEIRVRNLEILEMDGESRA